MAKKNKRRLKKRIHELCGAAAVQVMMHFPEHVSQDIVIKLARLQSGAISHISFAFDHVCRDFANCREYNKARRQYTRAAFGRLKSDFNKRLSEIVSDINREASANKKVAE